MSTATRYPANSYHTAHRLSAGAIIAIVAAHFAVFALLTSLAVVARPTMPAPLMVQIVAQTPPAPEVSPPRPTPIASKPVVRPKPTPLSRQPQLTALAQVSPASTEEAIVRDTQPPASTPSRAATTAVSQPHLDAAYLENRAPIYPALSRKMGEEGKVVLRVFVEASGRPGQIEIESGSASSRLDRAAQDAVWRWKFIPARRGEEATGAWVLVPIVFSLRS